MTEYGGILDLSVARGADHDVPVDIVSARGELDAFTVRRLRDVLLDRSCCSAPNLAIDLTGLTFVDSAAVSTILAGRRLCAARGGRTVLVTEEGSMVERILRLLRLHLVLEILPSLEVALAALPGSTGQGQTATSSMHMMLPSLSLNHAARPIPSSVAT